MDIWNVKNLEPPPVNSCTAGIKEIDIRLLSITLKDGIQFFENQQHLSTEAALLSRTVYRLKMKFRSSKDFKAVEKLSHVLRSYLQMQISKLLRTLADSIPQNYKISRTCILTKNMMDYVLVRIQGLGKILLRILETCEVISNLTQQRFRLGHFWKIAIVIYAITARIFVVTRSVFKYTCELYTSLLPFSSNLRNSGVRWLPEEYVLPNRLDEWLNVDCLNLENSVIEIHDDEPDLSYFRLIDDSDDDVEICDEYVLVNDEHSVSEEIMEQSDEAVELCDRTTPDIYHGKIKKPRNLIMSANQEDVDVGEVINLSNIETPKQSKKKRKTFYNTRKYVNLNQSSISISDVSTNDLESLKTHFNKSITKKRQNRNYRKSKRFKKKRKI